MMRLPSAVASVAILTIVLVGIVVIAGSGLSRATPESHGDLLLDWAVGDNTDVAVGTIDTSCKSFTAGTTVRIDVIAKNANDWAGMDFVFIYPAGSTGVLNPGPGDGGLDQFFTPSAGFDFVPFDGSTGATFGAQNLMSSAAGSAVDYSTTQAVPDGASPHGVSLFDNAQVGESGDGGIARISLDTTGLSAGVHTLSLGLTGAFAGGVHSDASGLRPDNAPTGSLPVTFASVQMGIGSTFDDVPCGHFAFAHIEALFDAGITGGCSAEPLLYCPDDPVTRAQMAVFIILALNDAPVTPTGVFDDVPPSAFAAGFIEKLAELGITAGCGDGNYCPNDPVTRAQMAVFIVVALGEAPLTPTGVFDDVPTSAFAAGFIEKLADLGITAGCSTEPLLYCPNDPVTRAQMAVFIVVAFNLLPP